MLDHIQAWGRQTYTFHCVSKQDDFMLLSAELCPSKSTLLWSHIGWYANSFGRVLNSWRSKAKMSWLKRHTLWVDISGSSVKKSYYSVQNWPVMTVQLQIHQRQMNWGQSRMNSYLQICKIWIRICQLNPLQQYGLATNEWMVHISKVKTQLNLFHLIHLIFKVGIYILNRWSFQILMESWEMPTTMWEQGNVCQAFQ